MLEQVVGKLSDLCARFENIGVTGPPDSWKTTACRCVVPIFIEIDRVLNVGDPRTVVPWPKQPGVILQAWEICKATQRAPRVIEGVQLPRAITEGLRVDALLITSLESVKCCHHAMASMNASVLETCLNQGYLKGVEVHRV